MAELVIKPYLFVLEAYSHRFQLHLVQEEAEGVLNRLNAELVHDVIQTYQTRGPATHLLAKSAGLCIGVVKKQGIRRDWRVLLVWLYLPLIEDAFVQNVPNSQLIRS